MIKLKVPKKRNIRNLMTKNITIFPALKSSEYPVYLESPLEADFCYHLEFKDNLTSYQAQPLGFCYWDKDNEAHIYA